VRAKESLSARRMTGGDEREGDATGWAASQSERTTLTDVARRRAQFVARCQSLKMRIVFPTPYSTVRCRRSVVGADRCLS
jgi:hypothetical protein